MLEIYNVLRNKKVLDMDTYNDLLKKYDEDRVNVVIEKMIDMDANFISKVDISNVVKSDKDIVKSVFDSYSIDIDSVPSLTKEENNKLCNEIFLLISEIKYILALDLEESEEASNLWLSDRLDVYLKKCKDVSVLNKLNKLYSEFIKKRNILTEGNLKFVIFVGKRYYNKMMDINDIIQFGNIGLMRACEKYDPSFNTSFTTYAYFWIKQSIIRGISCASSSVSVSYGLVSFNAMMNKAISTLSSVLDRTPTEYEIAEYMEVPVEKITTCMQCFADTASLNAPVGVSSSEGSEWSLMDALVDEDADVFRQVFNKHLSTEVLEFLKNILTEKEYMIVCSRYELDNCTFKTLNELGIEMGVCRERVRQMENNAIKKIKKRGKFLTTYIN